MCRAVFILRSSVFEIAETASCGIGVAETSWIMAFSCSDFKKLDDFSDYISDLRNETRFNSTILQQCQGEICTTLYGIGNPDMSGIGVRRIPVPEFPGPDC